MSTFQKLSDKKMTEMTEAERVAAYKSTQLQEPVLADLIALGVFTVVMYRDTTGTT